VTGSDREKFVAIKLLWIGV